MLKRKIQIIQLNKRNNNKISYPNTDVKKDQKKGNNNLNNEKTINNKKIPFQN